MLPNLHANPIKAAEKYYVLHIFWTATTDFIPLTPCTFYQQCKLASWWWLFSLHLRPIIHHPWTTFLSVSPIASKYLCLTFSWCMYKSEVFPLNNLFRYLSGPSRKWEKMSKNRTKYLRAPFQLELFVTAVLSQLQFNKEKIYTKFKKQNWVLINAFL